MGPPEGSNFPSWRKVCGGEKKEEERRKVIPNIVDTSFRSNAQGQCTHSARTNIKEGEWEKGMKEKNQELGSKIQV